MTQANEFYTERVLQQRMQRKKRKVQYTQVVDNGSDVDADSISDSSDVVYSKVLEDTTKATIVNQEGFDFKIDGRHFSDEDGSNHIYEYDLFSQDVTSPLYEQATVNIDKSVKRILNFCVDSNLDKLKVIALMHLIKSLLSVANHLPTTFHKILKAQGKISSSTSKLHYNNYLSFTTL
ncbi:unnamed protein product [Rotaria sp. Silwood2]|nr:unnamed protein product [Rotaria sp. Silwood2]CAF3039995.1 unnamed protein product [Rotaria sp. Silwood2]CAF3524491.1 unnamed protein product [Rotaria sp. Silwood2]CAF4348131.1 unnamed protein product [Rotaria sp. Silwood2]CAF4758613.1 unnamed protein product [Rotaria sp. Silwood2]